MVVVAAVKVRPANCGVEVVVTDWLIAEVPSKVKVLLLPCRVTLVMVEPLMLEFVVVELEAKKPEMVEVETVEVAMVELLKLPAVNVPWIFTFPLDATLNKLRPEEEATVSKEEVAPAVIFWT